MQAYENFRTQLHRSYPQVAKCAEELVLEYNRAVEESPEVPGSLEVEATFGRTDGRRFHNGIPPDAAQKLESMLDSSSDWLEKTEWYLVYDYHVDSDTRLRVSYRNPKHRVITLTRKHRLSQRTMQYGTGRCRGWKLRNYLTRVNMKFEEAIKQPSDRLSRYERIRLSVRKSYVIRSKNIPHIRWAYDLIKCWTAPTQKEAHEMMKTEPPSYSVECELCRDEPSALPEKEKLLAFTSLLLKMQDFLELPLLLTESGKREAQEEVPLFQMA